MYDQTSVGLGKQMLGGHKQSLCAPGARRKERETDPDLPVSVQESPAEAWVDRGLLQDQGH